MFCILNIWRRYNNTRRRNEPALPVELPEASQVALAWLVVAGPPDLIVDVTSYMPLYDDEAEVEGTMKAPPLF